jgi:DNA-binding NarL/FixJ family response regulator
MALAVKIRILMADDHAVVRAGRRLLIGTQTDRAVVGEAADGPRRWRSRETRGRTSPSWT